MHNLMNMVVFDERGPRIDEKERMLQSQMNSGLQNLKERLYQGQPPVCNQQR